MNKIRSTNSSRTYTVGRRFKSNFCGWFKIIGQSDRITHKYTEKGTLATCYNYFFCEFEDTGTVVEYSATSIRMGEVKDPWLPTLCGVGCLGQGDAVTKVDGKCTKEYKAWSGMIKRCYSEKSLKADPTYRLCSVAPRWKCFQWFWDDIPFLEGHALWKANKQKYTYALDKDIKIEGNKVYSKDTCMFVPWAENSSEANSRMEVSHLTGLVYIGTRLSDGYTEEFVNISEFSRVHNLDNSVVSKCCRGEREKHKGWTFRIKEELKQEQQKEEK